MSQKCKTPEDVKKETQNFSCVVQSITEKKEKNSTLSAVSIFV